MLHHASRLATTSLPLSSILQTAASRAWTRTRVVRQVSTVSPSLNPSGHLKDVRRSVATRRDAEPSTSHARHVQLNAARTLQEAEAISFALESPHEELSAVEHALSLEACPMTVTASSSTSHRSHGSRLHAEDLQSYRNLQDHFIPTNPYFIDIGLDPTPSLQTDPPWSDIIACMSEHGTRLVQTHHGELATENLPVTIPTPDSARSLLRNMRRLLTRTPPPSLKELLAYHASFRTHNSVKTFNFLLFMAIRFASFGTVRQLLNAMQLQGIGGNMETRRLAVRSLVRRGLWHEAWQQEMERERGRALPLSIWLIFFETAKRGATSLRISQPGQRRRFDETRWEVQDFTSAESDPSRIRILMQHPPFVMSDQLTDVPPRAIRLMVDAFLRTGEHELALSITSKYFQTLPQQLDEEWHARCLDIIHRHLRGGRKHAMQEHFRKRRLLRNFLGMHPSFRPTAVTLLYLLQDLKRSKKGYGFARNLVGKFTALWGESVVDDKVRRCLASLAVKQGLWLRANALQAYQRLLEESRKEYNAVEQVTTGSSIAGRSSNSASSFVSLYPRKNLEGWRWRLLRRRLWRLRSTGVRQRVRTKVRVASETET